MADKSLGIKGGKATKVVASGGATHGIGVGGVPAGSTTRPVEALVSAYEAKAKKKKATSPDRHGGPTRVNSDGEIEGFPLVVLEKEDSRKCLPANTRRLKLGDRVTSRLCTGEDRKKILTQEELRVLLDNDSEASVVSTASGAKILVERDRIGHQKEGSETVDLTSDPEEMAESADSDRGQAGSLLGRFRKSVLAVERVVANSGNLKREFKDDLRMAVIEMRAMLTASERKTAPPTTRVSPLKIQNNFLRQRNKELVREAEALRREIVALKTGQQSSSSPGRSPPTKRSRRATEMETVAEGGGGERDASPSLPPPAPSQGDRDEVVATALGADLGGSDVLERMGALLGTLVATQSSIWERLGSIERRFDSSERALMPPPAPVAAGSGRMAALGASGLAEEREKKKKRGKGEGKGEKAPAAPLTPTPSTSSVCGKETGSNAFAEEPFSRVVGRKERRAARKAVAPSPLPPSCPPVEGGQGGGRKAAGHRVPKRGPPAPRPPSTAAVTLTVPEGVGLTYAEALRLAREAVPPEDLTRLEGDGLRLRRSQTGGYVFEIPGRAGAEKADHLAGQLAAALSGRGVRVARPTKRADLRVRGLDDSVTQGEVATALAGIGGCPVGEVRVGEIRSSPAGMGSVWVQAPAYAVRRVVNERRVRIGWFLATAEPLAPRPLHCYRCLEVGHTQQRCSAEKDRRGRCYRCGGAAHRANECRASAPKCPLCADLGLPAGHRLGGPGCKPHSAAGGTRGGRTARLAPPAAVDGGKTASAGLEGGGGGARTALPANISEKATTASADAPTMALDGTGGGIVVEETIPAGTISTPPGRAAERPPGGEYVGEDGEGWTGLDQPMSPSADLP